MRWSAPGAEGLLETAETSFEAAVWPEPPQGFDLIGPRRPMRQVLTGSLPWPGTPRVVIKWSRPVTATDEVARYLRGGKGPREGRLLRTLAERGIHVPRVLAFTDEGVDLLITEHLEGLRPLPRAPRGEVVDPDLIVAIATFLGRVYHRGLRHRDLHRGNLAIRGGRILLVDVGGAHLARGSGLVTEMARAAGGLTEGLTRTQRMRAVRAYLREAEGVEPGRTHLIETSEAVDRRARELTRRYRLGRDRRATRTGRHYEVFRLGRASGIRRRDAPEAWKEHCAAWVGEDLDGAVLLKEGGHVVQAVLPDREQPVVLKRYAPVAPGRLPRAVRAFRLAAILEHRFVAAPRALLAFASRRGSVLVSELVPGEDLHRFTDGGRGGTFASLDRAQRSALLEALGRFLRHMHEEEISHRDLKAPNLVVTDVERSTFVIADLEGAARRIVSWKRRAHDLARLDASLDATRTDRARVLGAYLRAGRRPPVDTKTFTRWIAERVASKRGPSGRPK